MSIDDVLNAAVSDGDVPFVVAMAANRNGVTYSGAAGPASATRAADEATAFRIFSMTKAIGSLAAMILIDRGQLSMDTAVGDILPGWNDLQVLDGWDGNKPRMRAPRTQATIRHLATHTSGLEYEFWNPDMPKYMEAAGVPTILAGTKAALMQPLTSDPGTRWGYGQSIDWLGQVVEAVSGQRIDAFCQAEIFDPLGMADTAFEPDALQDRLADVSIRGEDGAFGPFEIAPPAAARGLWHGSRALLHCTRLPAVPAHGAEPRRAGRQPDPVTSRRRHNACGSDAGADLPENDLLHAASDGGCRIARRHHPQLCLCPQ